MDIGSPIDFTYDLPFAFTGTIDHVTIDLKPAKPAAEATDRELVKAAAR
jgi:arylsulfatase